MSAINSLNAAIFMSGAEGSILLTICIIAGVCTLAVIALAILVAVTIKRRKRDGVHEISEVEKSSPAETAEQPVQLQQSEPEQPQQVEPEQPPAEAILKPPAKIRTVSSSIFPRSGTLYYKSFMAKLIQSPDEVKSWYSRLKNRILSYKKVKSRMSWKRESFRLGRKIVARFGYRGNTLCVYLPLDPADYDGTKYRIEDVSAVAAYADAPCMYRIKSERRARYAAELIAALMSTWEIEPAEREEEDFYLPYEQTEPLIEKGLIKVVNVQPKQTVSQDFADEIDEAAAAEATEEQPTEENLVEETAEEEQPAEEETVEEQSVEEVEEVSEEALEQVTAEEETASEEIAVDDSTEEPIEEEGATLEEVASDQPNEDPVEEVSASEELAVSEPTAEPVAEAEVEQPPAEKPDDVETHEDEDGIEVVGVTFRRRGKKVYWFDPDGKTWEKGEVALYITPTVPPQEVVVVETAKISPSKLHLPLKPLHKFHPRPKKR